ncbi:protein regulator of cytokinesis 1 isoform X1 [Hydra vulgaris]|uniref:protein regulator of cytokinesis 1 isoform X1 n=1 Tax=Hydra vulgaris TaxID=6087 RepID=UPI001F5FF05C|nr:protein regulator of cytokinesis 1 [Hydra vulgaris]
MSEFTQAVTLYTSTDGEFFNPLTGIDICKNCGKKTLVCPHKLLPKEGIIQLPTGSTHLKVIRIEPDLRATLSTEKNRRITSIFDNMKFSLLESVTNLEDIWESIGISEEQKDNRNKTVLDHLQQLLNEMVAEEEQLKSKMQLKVKEYQEELDQLCKDLAIPPKQIPANLSLLQLENRLRGEVDTLNKEKHDRLKSLKRIRNDEQLLCERLMMPQHELVFIGCPTLDQLRELEQNVKFLKTEKTSRMTLFKKLQASIMQLWRELDSEPSNEFEEQLCHPDSDENFVLSSQHLDDLTELQKKLQEEHSALLQQIESLRNKVISLWDRLETTKSERDEFLPILKSNTPKSAKALMKEISRLEELKRLHMQKFIESIRKELAFLWDKCYFGEEQRIVFQAFYSDIYTEDTLAEHEHQVATLKNYYEENKELFKLVEKRENLWKKKVEFESRATDTNRLNNRGGALLKEEKTRKSVEKELPKVENELRKKIIVWERENESYFLFNGNRYVDYIEIQKNEFEECQKEKKEEKLRVKLEELDNELKFGSTSSKRKHVGTPGKAKTPKMDITHGTPGRFVHSSLFSSPRHPVHFKENNLTSAKSLVVNVLKKAVKNKTAKINKIQNESRRKSLKRRSVRLASAKRVLSEKNGNAIDSHLDVSVVSGSIFKNSNPNASLVSYNDFSNAVAESPFSRSSFLCNPTERAPSMQNSFTNISNTSKRTSSRNTNRIGNSNSNKTLTEQTPKTFRV